MRPTLALAALAAAMSPAAAASSFYDRYVPGPHGASPCYARLYTAEHLAAHPRQKVTRFHLVGSDDDRAGSARAFAIDFGFRLRDSHDVFVGHAACAGRGDGAACTVEGDGGALRLEPRPDGILVAVDGRLAIEGVDGFSPDLYESDDRAFRLHVADPEDCLFDSFGDDDRAREPLTPSIARPE